MSAFFWKQIQHLLTTYKVEMIMSLICTCVKWCTNNFWKKVACNKIVAGNSLQLHSVMMLIYTTKKSIEHLG